MYCRYTKNKHLGTTTSIWEQKVSTLNGGELLFGVSFIMRFHCISKAVLARKDHLL